MSLLSTDSIVLAEVLRAALDHQPIGVGILDSSSLRFRYANPHLEALVPGGSLVGATIAEAFPRHAALIEMAAKRARETGEQIAQAVDFSVSSENAGPAELHLMRLELQQVSADGDSFLLVTASTTSDASDRAESNRSLAAAIGVASDGIPLSDEQAAGPADSAESLQQERLRLKAVLDNLPLAIGLSDASGRVIMLNDGVERLWGGAPKVSGPEEYRVYQGWWAETGEPVQPDEWTTYRALVEQRPVYGDVMKIRRFDGGERFIHSSAVPVYDERGDLFGVVGVAKDITEQRERMKLSEALNEIGLLIHSGRSPENTLPEVLDIAADALEADEARVALHDGECWRFAYDSEGSPGILDDVEDCRVCLFERVRETRDIVLSDEWCDDDAREKCPYGVTFAMPLLVENEVVGALTLHDRAEHTRPRVAVVSFCRRLATMIALAIDNATLLRSKEAAEGTAREELDATTLLLKLATDINELLELDDVLDSITSSVVNALGIARFGVLLFDASTGEFEVASGTGDIPFPLGYRLRLSDLVPHVRESLSRGRTCLVDYDLENVNERFAAHLRDAGVRSVVWIPLVRDGLVGAFVADEPEIKHEYRGRDLRLLEGIGAQAAVAIENARFFEAERENARMNEALAEIDRLVHSTLEFDEVMCRALARGAEAMGADTSAVALLEGDEIRATHSWGYVSDIAGQVLPADHQPHALDALASQRIVAIDDVSRTEIDADATRVRGLKAVAVAPLIVRGRSDACLLLNYTSAAHRFTEAEIAFLEKLSSSLSLALENAQLFEQQRRAMTLSRAINDIDAKITRSLTIDRVLSHVLVIACEALGAESGSIAHADGDEMIVRESYRLLEPWVDARFTLEHASHVQGAIESNCVVTIADTLADERTADLPLVETRAMMVIPLFVADEVFGVILVNHDHAHVWTDEEVDFGIRLGTHVSLALRNASLFELERTRRRLSDRVNWINDVVHSTLEFDEIVQQVFSEAIDAVDAEAGGLAIRESGGWVFRHQYGELPATQGLLFPDEDMPFAATLRGTRTPIVVNDPLGSSATSAGFVEQLGIKAFIAAPLIARDDLFGLVFLSRHQSAECFTEEDGDFAGKLGASLSLAIENARLYQEERRSARLAEALNEVNQILLSTLDVERMLEEIVSRAAEAIGADVAALLEPSADVWTFTSTHELDPSLRGQVLDLENAAPFLHVATHRVPILVEDAAFDDRFEADLCDELGLNSYMLLPLQVQGSLLGVLMLASREPAQFEARELEFAQRLSTAISIALENARLFQNEHQIAETLQETLLVLPNNVKGIEYATLYHSATISARVGGDFVDVFQLSGRRVGLSLGDVSGKGIEAATLTAMVRNTLRAHAVESLPPSVVAEKTNDLLHLFTPVETYCTAMYGVLDTRTGKLTYVSAGHPAALIVGTDGSVRQLAEQGPVLGAFPGIEYHDGHAVLEPGECLLMYSDGVIEARRGRELFGEERLIEILSAHAGRPPQEIIDGVYEALNEFSGGQLRDDVALLATCRRAQDNGPSEGQEQLDL